MIIGRVGLGHLGIPMQQRVSVPGAVCPSTDVAMVLAPAIGARMRLTGQNKCPETFGEGDAQGPSPLFHL